jgi:dienelactone hydrolase
MARAHFVASAALSMILSGCDWLINEDEETHRPSTFAPVGSCPKLMHGIECAGETLGGGPHTVEDLAGCCELCSNTSICAAFSYRADTGACALKKECILKKDWNHGLNRTSATMPGRMSVQRGWTQVEGYKCSAQKDTVLFFPDLNGSYPVIVYGHGTWGAIDGMDEWLETISANGFIVIAPFMGQRAEGEAPCTSDSSSDMVHVLEQAKIQGAALHPSLAMADWSRSGVFGHSRGGHYVPLAANLMQRSKHQLNVAAMVVSHAAPWNVPMRTPVPAVPAMFTTGTEDQHDNKDHHVYNFYKNYPALNKVYANLVGAHHMEPLVGKRLNTFTALFFSCHLSRSKAACDLIYGKAPEALCQAYAYEKCLAHMNGPMLDAPENRSIISV